MQLENKTAFTALILNLLLILEATCLHFPTNTRRNQGLSLLPGQLKPYQKHKNKDMGNNEQIQKINRSPTDDAPADQHQQRKRTKILHHLLIKELSCCIWFWMDKVLFCLRMSWDNILSFSLRRTFLYCFLQATFALASPCLCLTES